MERQNYIMKYMIASDIHGSSKYCSKLIEAFESSHSDMLILLGDILYHGPRNDLPEEYSPKTVIDMLNGIADKLICIRGNCDSEVDQMVLNFPIMADYAVLSDNSKRRIYMTHGHIYGPDNMPKLHAGDVILSGHTHIPMHEIRNGILCVNPGSVSIPKNGSDHSYIILENEKFEFLSLK